MSEERTPYCVNAGLRDCWANWQEVETRRAVGAASARVARRRRWRMLRLGLRLVVAALCGKGG